MPFSSRSKQAIVGHTLLGSSAYMRKLRAQISGLARTDLDVLIRGETGTGKELVAHALHAAGARATRKMVTVNMAAIPAELAPAALFGSARGAFTGANKATVGYFERAEGGILFLDEIGDTPEKIQAQLLRVLQQREVQIVGGPIRTVDLRIISATDARLDEPSCNFKAALRHRLAQSEITLLPLREHPEDIGELLWFFVQSHMSALGRGHLLPEEGSSADEIATWADLFHHFLRYKWPGNIRELGNFSQQLAVASELSVSIPETVRERLCPLKGGAVHENATTVKEAMPKPAQCSNQDFRAGYASARYEVAKAARQLGISRQAVYRHISDSPDLCLASELSQEQIQRALHKSKGNLTEAATYLKVSRMALRERIRNSPLRRAG
jgi:two-component system nitrogen regulation response regulator GlnG